MVRALLAHTPRDPFVQEGALEAFEDGAVAFADGRIVGCGAYGEVSGRFPGAEVLDARDAVLLPGFVDCHVHYPQIRVIGAMGLELMDWLRLRALPEEVRLADEAYVAEVAERFVRGLLANGTALLDVCGELERSREGLLFTSHLNESRSEIELVRERSPWLGTTSRRTSTTAWLGRDPSSPMMSM